MKKNVQLALSISFFFRLVLRAGKGLIKGGIRSSARIQSLSPISQCSGKRGVEILCRTLLLPVHVLPFVFIVIFPERHHPAAHSFFFNNERDLEYFVFWSKRRPGIPMDTALHPSRVYQVRWNSVSETISP